MSDGYHVDTEQVQRLDAQHGLPPDDHPLTGPLVTPKDVQRFVRLLAEDTAAASSGVQELAESVGYSAIVQALVDLGVLVEADRWADLY